MVVGATKAWAGNGLVSEDHAAGWAARAGRRRGAGADTWAGKGLVSEDHAIPRKALRGTVMKPILVNARSAGAAAVRSPLRCCGLPTPLLGSEISEAPWQTPRHWQSLCTGSHCEWGLARGRERVRIYLIECSCQKVRQFRRGPECIFQKM